MNLLGKLWDIANPDLTGKEYARTLQHPYFGRITFREFGDGKPGYWEADLAVADGQRVGIAFDFISTVRSARWQRLDSLCRFSRCRSGASGGWVSAGTRHQLRARRRSDW